MDGLSLRLATHDDVPSIVKLIDASVRGLSTDFYTVVQIDQALQHGIRTGHAADR